MDIPQIKIQQGLSQIGLKSTRGHINIQQPRSSLNIHQENGSLEINKTQGSLEIDSRKAWSALGKARFGEVTDRIAQSSLRISMQNIGDIAQAGDRMMACHIQENAFAEIARQNVFEENSIEICGPARYDNVDISYSPDRVHMTYTQGGVSFDPEIKKPNINYYPGKVNPYLIQKNFIFMSATGEQLDAVI